MLTRFGTQEQRERYLPRLATGEVRATMALTEPDGGSDLQAIRTVARPLGNWTERMMLPTALTAAG